MKRHFSKWSPILIGSAGLCVLVLTVSLHSARAASPPCRFIVSGQTVRDSITGLTWQQSISSSPCGVAGAGCYWTQAEAYCSGLSYGGFSAGWRLPTVKELASLVDVSTHNPAIDQHYFPGTPSAWFWTATQTGNCVQVSQSDADCGWAVDFGSGAVSGTLTPLVRCVR
jgi:hypothetical protein